MSKRPFGLPRVVALAVVLIAAALMLLRPVCESWHGGASSQASTFERMAMSTGIAGIPSGGTLIDACCSSDDASVVSAVRAVNFDRSSDSGSITPSLVAAVLIVFSVAAGAVFRRRAEPRTPQSYYLRSARILR